MVAERLDNSAVDAAVAAGDWQRVDGSLVLDRSFKDFEEAWAFASQVAAAAEAADHHPDILAHGWNKVRVTLSTHSAGGITQLDLDLASVIGAIEL